MSNLGLDCQDFVDEENLDIGQSSINWLKIVEDYIIQPK